MYIYIYIHTPLIFQIAATNIISSTAGLSLKYKKWSVRASQRNSASYQTR